MRTLTVSSLFRQEQNSIVPSIRLNGKWLASLGITPGQKVRVVTNDSIITIAPVVMESELKYYASETEKQSISAASENNQERPALAA